MLQIQDPSASRDFPDCRAPGRPVGRPRANSAPNVLYGYSAQASSEWCFCADGVTRSSRWPAVERNSTRASLGLGPASIRSEAAPARILGSCG